MKYYEKKDFARAVALFEDILPIIRGTKEAESANFYYAYAHFYQDLFILSAHYFETFLEISPKIPEISPECSRKILINFSDNF